MSAATRPLDLTDPGTVTRVARQAGLFAKRRLGQHFLVDRGALDAIVEALNPAPGDTVWEIGPGIGVLTAELARRAARVVAVDLDPACIRAARVTLRGLPNVELIEGDALRVDAAGLGLPDDHLAAGNLPYNLTGALLAHLFEAAVPPRRGVFLVQREVAARIASPPGGWSLATVAVRSVADVERLGDVPAASFMPEPAVASSIIRMHPARPMPEAERRDVLRLARAAFQLGDYAVFDGEHVDATIVTTHDAARRLQPQLAGHPAVDIVAVDAAVDAAGGSGINLSQAVSVLHQRHGIRHLLCEGGPALYTAMLTAGLIDEKFLTVSPLEVGAMSPHGPRPTVLPNVGFSRQDAVRWRWLSCRKVADYQFHRFRRQESTIC